MLNVVLVEPEIPPNTGNIGRLCLASGSRLHLVKPLGFDLDAKQVRRAGLDYWDQVDLRLWDSFSQLRASIDRTGDTPRLFLATTKGATPHWDARFSDGDFLVFGRETKGLPESLLARHPEDCIRIPMQPEARSLNLATAVGIVLFEALRQIHA